MDGGAVVAVLVTQRDVELLLRAPPFKAAPFKDSDNLAAFKQVEPIYAFELIITGIGDADPSFMFDLDNYFHHRYIKSNGQSAWVSTRKPDRDCYCFIMEDWNVVKQVLEDNDFYNGRIGSKFPGIQRPRLLWLVNNDNLWRLSYNTSIRSDGDSVMKSIDAINTHLDSMQKENNANFMAIDARFNRAEEGMKAITQAVGDLDNRLQSTQMALFSQHHRSQLQDNRNAYERRIDFLTCRLDIEPSQRKVDQIRAEIENLFEKIETEDKEISSADDAFSAATAPTIPSITHRSNKTRVPSNADEDAVDRLVTTTTSNMEDDSDDSESSENQKSDEDTPMVPVNVADNSR
ncbi:hypothetical protein B0H13DRAFT_2319546 [Mycena leptocephala]|nr:hypothetical protein B0H13DRAFT_2319546 [Mycena leptocephala]